MDTGMEIKYAKSPYDIPSECACCTKLVLEYILIQHVFINTEVTNPWMIVCVQCAKELTGKLKEAINPVP